MYCRKCGGEISSTSRFCPKCGTPVVGQPSSGQGSVPIISSGSVTEGGSSQMMGKEGSLRMVEGALSVVAALVIVFAPSITVDLYFAGTSCTLLSVILRLSKYSEYLEEFTVIVIVLGILMVASVVEYLINAKQCFDGTPSIKKDPKTGKNALNIDHVFMGVPYSIMLIVVLALCSNESYGIIKSNGWVWITLLICTALFVVHVMRATSEVEGQ